MAETQEQKFVVGIYEDDQVLLKAVDRLKDMGYKIADAFTPFPVHHLDVKLGYKESRLPDAAFVFGITGTSLALLMQIWMYTVDWPVNVGGKPHLPLPSFIPITFELTVLLASFGMVFTYLYANRLAPGIQTKIIDPRQTDDLFILTVEAKEDSGENKKLHDAFRETGAVETREEAYERQFLNVEP